MFVDYPRVEQSFLRAGDAGRPELERVPGLRETADQREGGITGPVGDRGDRKKWETKKCEREDEMSEKSRAK